MTLALTGHAVARGIAIGRCHLLERNEFEIGEYRIGAEEVKKEIRRYRDAVDAARDQLTELSEGLGQAVAAPAGEIIQTHIMMLGDSTLRRKTEEHIERELCNAEWALQTQLEEILVEFRSMDDDYIRTRGDEFPRDLLVPFDGCGDEGRVVFPVLRVQVDTVCDEFSDNFDMPVLGCEHQYRVGIVHSRVYVSAVLKKYFDDLNALAPHCLMKQCPSMSEDSVCISALVEQRQNLVFVSLIDSPVRGIVQLFLGGGICGSVPAA